MLGAIIGDVVGSRFEHNNTKTKEFSFMPHMCFFTDDSVMTLAVAKAILACNGDYTALEDHVIQCMNEYGHRYPNAGYGGSFRSWLKSSEKGPYNSFGNGAAMRISACAYAANSLDEVKHLSKIVTEVTHNHPEGIKGAEAASVAIYMALKGASIFEIRDYINNNYYPMNFSLDSIRDSYRFDVSCQGSVPQAIMAFLESADFEDAIRNAISIGGDSDTIAAIAGSIAEAYYGIPADLRKLAVTFLDEELLATLNSFESKYGIKVEKKVDDIVRPIDYSPEVKTNTQSTREEMIITLVDNTDDAMSSSTVGQENIRANELHSFLYEACNILHGAVAKSSFKTYIIPILFLKRISDCYDEETIKLKEDYGDGWMNFLDDDYHRFSIPSECRWNTLRETTDNVGSAIVNAMLGIEQANPSTLTGLFTSFDEADWTNKNTLPDRRLKDLIEHFSRKNLSNRTYDADVMGDAYEYLIRHFAEDDNRNAGDFYTPRTIVRLLIKLLNPKKGETIYDPACGTGGMLIEYVRNMDNPLQVGKDVYGQENMHSTSAIARMNLFLHGIEDFDIKTGDTLRNPLFIERGQLKKFDCVVANPPFGLEGWGADQFESDIWGRNIWGSPSDSNADYAWIQHIVKSMKDKHGRAAFIMPQGVLFHGNKEGKMREDLVKTGIVEAVITLPSGVFYKTGVSACIILLNNNMPIEHRGKIAFINASTIYHPKRAQIYMDLADIEKVYKLFADYTDVVDFVKIATLEDVAKQNYDLSVNKYIDKTPPPPIDPKKVRDEYFKALDAVIVAEENLKELLRKGGYLDE